jgi:hypothetical protein
MSGSPRTDRMGDMAFFALFTLAHAAIAFPTLGLWAQWCERRKRP